MTSAMARASTLSVIVTPHWCEIVSSNVMSFIDLKMLSCSCNMSVSRRVWLRGVGLDYDARLAGTFRPSSVAIPLMRFFACPKASPNVATLTRGCDQLGCRRFEGVDG